MFLFDIIFAFMHVSIPISKQRGVVLWQLIEILLSALDQSSKANSNNIRLHLVTNQTSGRRTLVISIKCAEGCLPADKPLLGDLDFLTTLSKLLNLRMSTRNTIPIFILAQVGCLFQLRLFLLTQRQASFGKSFFR